MSIYGSGKEKALYFVVCALALGMAEAGAQETTLEERLTFLDEDFEGTGKVRLKFSGGNIGYRVVRHEMSRKVFHGGKQSEHLKIEYEDYGGAAGPHSYWDLSPTKTARVAPGCMIEFSMWIKANRRFHINIDCTGGVMRGAGYDGSGEWRKIVIRNLYQKIYSRAFGSKVPTDRLTLNVIYLNPSIKGLTTPIDIYIDDAKLYSLIPSEIEKMKKSREKLAKKLTARGGEKYREELEKIYTGLDEIEKAIRKDITRDEEALVKMYNDFKDLLERYTALVKKLVFLRGISAEVEEGRNKAAANYVVRVIKSPITDEKLLATASLEEVEGSENVERADRLSLFACRGEYESVSFVIHARGDLNKIKIGAGDLKGKGGMIPARAVDIRVVKCWYQGGPGLGFDGTKHLTPELLLKNDDLIRVDYDFELNEPVNYKTVKDTGELQPFDIPTDTLKQIWVTVHVPDGVGPGDYEGVIDVTPSGASSTRLKLRVKVLPFNLEKPRLEYSIYYHGQLTPYATIGPFYKSAEQMLADFKYMKSHGINNPSVSQVFDPAKLKQVLELRREARMDNKAILYLEFGVSTGSSSDPKDLEHLKERVRERLKVFKENGVSEVYFHGVDEAAGERLKAQRPAWQAVHEAGGKVFVACSKGFFEAAGDLLDLPIYAHLVYGPNPGLPSKVHTYPGHKLYCYSAWSGQLGVELPYTVRSAYGLGLWKAGYDGVCEYAYQHPFPWAKGHDRKGITLWDDFDTVPPASHRDFVMAYTTIDGVVPTIHGEGFREGVDDVRYMTTLEKTLKKAKKVPSLSALVRDTERWLKNLDIKKKPLQEIRRDMAQRIMKLQTGY